MLVLNSTLEPISGEHRRALEWFQQNAGTQKSWAEITSNVESGARLVTQAKGIYKPDYMDYALSVRQTLSSPYADLEVERRPNGSWVYPYFQEGLEPSERDRMFTNRGLMKCMQDNVPVGVLIQKNAKPNTTYEVLGLALVNGWQNGYFILQGFSHEGHAHAPDDPEDATSMRAATQTQTRANFDPSKIDDTRQNRLLR
jgi:putative restriction endonuclease